MLLYANNHSDYISIRLPQLAIVTYSFFSATHEILGIKSSYP
jgi:hypothetical protein